MASDHDIIIIGGGAAGLSAAQYGARANLRALVIEELALGGQALTIDRLENYPGIPEPINGYDFSESLRAQAVKFGAETLMASVQSVRKEGDTFFIGTTEGQFTSRALVIATGSKHRLLGVPGEETFSGRGVSYCATCDGPFFKGKTMLVVGGGDAACDEAMYLSKLSDKIILVHRRESFRAQAAVAQRVQDNKNIELRFNTIVKSIQGDKKVQSVVLEKVDTGENYELPVDAVFVFVGTIPQTALFPDCEKDEIGSIITDQRMESSVKGLFAVGDVRATPFRQLIVAAGEGAVAAHCAAQYLDELNGARGK